MAEKEVRQEISPELAANRQRRRFVFEQLFMCQFYQAEEIPRQLDNLAEDTDLLEIPLYRERFLAYVSEDNPAYSQESIKAETLLKQPIWIMRDGLGQLDLDELNREGFTYERFYEGGRVGTLIQVVNNVGGITIVPETHTNLIMYSHQRCLRPIVDPVPSRAISLIIRRDYIHEAMLNAVVDAIKWIIPGVMLENGIRGSHLKL